MTNFTAPHVIDVTTIDGDLRLTTDAGVFTVTEADGWFEARRMDGAARGTYGTRHQAVDAILDGTIHLTAGDHRWTGVQARSAGGYPPIRDMDQASIVFAAITDGKEA